MILNNQLFQMVLKVIVLIMVIECTMSRHLDEIGSRGNQRIQANNEVLSRRQSIGSSIGFQANQGSSWVQQNQNTFNTPINNHRRLNSNEWNTNNNNNNNFNHNNNINQNNNINTNLNFNDGSGDSLNNGQRPVTNSLNTLIQQQILTKTILIHLLRRQLLDINGRYSQDPNARGDHFVDPRSLQKSEPALPSFSNKNNKQTGSITIETSGSFKISEVVGPDGRVQLVIDARKKPTSTAAPAEEKPEAEKSGR